MAAPMVHVCEGKHQAVIAKYSNGRLKRSASGDIKHVWYRYKDQADERRKHRQMLVAETDRLDYSGSIAQRQGTGIYDYYIGLLDKQSNTLRISNASTFHMNPKLPGSEDKPTPEKKDFNSLSFIEKSNEFIDAFGSIRKKRAVENRKKNSIDSSVLETAVGAALNQSLSDSRNQSLLDVSVSSPSSSNDSSELIPPHDVTAITPEQVYKINDILPDHEYEMLQSYTGPFTDVSHVEIQEWRKQNTYGEFILNHLATLPLQEVKRKKKATFLLYLQYMMTLYHRKAIELKKKEPLPADWPESVKRSLLERFTVQVGGDGAKSVRCMPARLKDKLLSYMIVLALHIDDFHMPFEVFQQDSKVGVSRLIDHVRALGCKVESSKSKGSQKTTKHVTLPLPLKFPERKTPKGKGRR